MGEGLEGAEGRESVVRMHIVCEKNKEKEKEKNKSSHTKKNEMYKEKVKLETETISEFLRHRVIAPLCQIGSNY